MPRTSSSYEPEKNMSSSASIASTLQDSDWKSNFTAIGGPMPNYQPSTWANTCLWGLQAPQYPPFRFTDDSIITVIVPVKKSNKPDNESSNTRSRSSGKIHNFIASLRPLEPETTVVMMPRREYLRYFARNADGDYTGTESERCWSEEELHEKFRKYQNIPPQMWVSRECEGRTYMEEEHRQANVSGRQETV